MSTWSDVKHRLNPGNWPAFQESQESKDRKASLYATGQASNAFSGSGELDFRRMNNEAYQAREYLKRLASGQESVSREQLRQGLQQNVNAQRSMAASASPSNGPMASLMAMQNSGRLNAGISGQAALAGIQERSAAQQALANMVLQQRQQDVSVALGGRQNAIGAYGGTKPEGSWIEKYGPAIAGAAAIAASDRRLKTDIGQGDDAASKAIDGVKAHVYSYKDEKYGKGPRLGVMAQDLEKSGLGHAVIDTPDGKMVHGGHLSTANTAMIAALGRRVAELEGKRKGAAAAMRRG